MIIYRQRDARPIEIIYLPLTQAVTWIDRGKSRVTHRASSICYQELLVWWRRASRPDDSAEVRESRVGGKTHPHGNGEMEEEAKKTRGGRTRLAEALFPLCSFTTLINGGLYVCTIHTYVQRDVQ